MRDNVQIKPSFSLGKKMLRRHCERRIEDRQLARPNTVTQVGNYRSNSLSGS